jgi:hypothetical protein
MHVLDPRFKTKEGLSRASKLGDIRALHPDLSIKEHIIHESFDGGKPGEYAEVHHPYTVIDGVCFQLRPANYLKYRPSDILPDDTPVYIVSVGEY